MTPTNKPFYLQQSLNRTAIFYTIELSSNCLFIFSFHTCTCEYMYCYFLYIFAILNNKFGMGYIQFNYISTCLYFCGAIEGSSILILRLFRSVELCTYDIFFILDRCKYHSVLDSLRY